MKLCANHSERIGTMKMPTYLVYYSDKLNEWCIDRANLCNYKVAKVNAWGKDHALEVSENVMKSRGIDTDVWLPCGVVEIDE